MKVSKGFTLIELMIVVAIVGILVSIAIPSYQDFTVRAKVTEGISLASAPRISVEDSWAASPVFPLTGLPSSPTLPASDPVQSVVTDANTGQIVVTFNSNAGLMNGHTITMTPSLSGNQAVSWVCQVDLPSNNRFVPPNCRI